MRATCSHALPLLSKAACLCSYYLQLLFLVELTPNERNESCGLISMTIANQYRHLSLLLFFFALLSVVLSLLLLYLPTELFGVPTSLPHSFMSSMHYLLASTTTKVLYPTLYFDNSVESTEERREKCTFLMCLEVEPTHFIFYI